MAATIPPQFRDLLETKKAFAHLATLMPDGSPQVSVVWIGVDGDEVVVAHLGARHRLAHPGGGLRHGVGAEVDGRHGVNPLPAPAGKGRVRGCGC